MAAPSPSDRQEGLPTETRTPPTNTTVPLLDSPRVRIARYDEYFNQRTFQTTLRKSGNPVSQRKVEQKRPTLVVRRIINARGQHKTTVVDIKSEGLREVLLSINRSVQHVAELTKPCPSVDPKVLLYSRAGLQQRLLEEKSRENKDKALIDDITIALEFIKEDFGDTISQAEALVKCGEITFDLLWILFPPNTTVYHRHHYTEQDRVLLCINFSYQVDSFGNPYGVLECEVICSDGSLFGLAMVELEIPTFDGSCKIIDLLAYPLKDYADEVALRASAIARGKKFVNVVRQCFETSGPAMVQKENRQLSSDPLFEKSYCYGRVMIDAGAFRALQMNNRVIVRVFRSLNPSELTDEEYLIFNPVVLGFCFATKTWGGFAVERLMDVVWSGEPFKELVLEQKQKHLIQSLVKQHFERSMILDDVVEGKGLGLVGLLCGNPGCGKTLTAEAISEATRRPLLVMNAGDLGTKPEEVDKSLKHLLRVAEMWNTILLLDEADVFMQKRSLEDLTRNALVSIFLRHLEYYKGIMILTTNMPGQCDPAFQSRIHFCVRYPDLDYGSRQAIWKLFLKKAMGTRYDIQEEDLAHLAGRPMNGRQIKNVVSSAQCLALDEPANVEKKLSIKHIQMVMEVANDWEIAIGPTRSLISDRGGEHQSKWGAVYAHPVVLYFFISAHLLAMWLSVVYVSSRMP